MSQQRTASVPHGPVARGVLAERFQFLAKGASEPAAPTPAGVPKKRRRVEIR